MKGMSKLFFRYSSVIRILIVSMALFTAPRMFGVGWTPTDAGLVVNLEQGERFLLSVWVDKNSNGTEEDGEEFFVSNYTRYDGGYYGYGAGTYMKLLPATKVTEMNEWAVGAPLARDNKALGAKEGTVYTIWNDGKTLKTRDKFNFLGELTSDYNDGKACDVVFVIPTERGVPTVQGRGSLSSFDPNNTLKRGKAPFNGRMGTGFLGMTYREVYMFEIPKANSPQSYTNAGLVTFNTTLSTWNLTSGAGSIEKGKAAYAYADSKHDKTPRTLFRLYLLDNPMNSCSSYFFATDEQDDMRYRKTEDRLPSSQTAADSTAKRKIYTMDRLMCMSRDGSTKYYRTDLMRVPAPDNTYYYVGYDNKYKDDDGESMGTGGAKSHFTNIRELPMKDLSGFKAPAGAYGQMVVDTTSAADNLGVAFEPVGYFLKIKETGKNIRLHKTGDYTWTSEEMWTISGYYVSLHIRTMLMTGLEFREDDEGAPVEGWSKWVRGDSVPTSDGESIVGESGYAQITINNNDSNGHMVFITADNTKWIRYDNNGFMGLEMPKQYPLDNGTNTVVLMEPRIKPEYTFLGWDTQADGKGTRYQVGDEFTFTEAGEVKLYAQARYDGTLQMAISFMQGGKRYFLTHPGREAPRYARARHFEHWENTWQGMENAENEDPNYLSTYELRFPIADIKRKDGDIPDLDIKERVLDPRHYTMKGYTDSLTFYENFTPAKDEYIGLYYEEAFNTILANNTWAGLFTTTSKATELSWPNYKVPYITGVKIKSERYVKEYDPENKPDSLILKVRANRDKSYVKYDPVHNQFNGQADSASATTFDVSAVIVADEHYIILPDTTHEWRDSLLFDFHQNEQSHRDVWSALIGKQLMAVMIIDGDTVYFHPSRDPRKNINDPNNLYLSPAFRVTQTFELIRDSRVSGSISAGDSARVESTDHYWHYDIVSGQTSPINVRDRSGNYIDVVDTFRITLSHGDISKIKEYRGRWNRNAAGLKINKDGSRYRDVIVHTKSYHYGDTLTRTVLKAEKERYNFGPLAGQSQQINFLLLRETYRQMLDKDGNKEGEYILSVDTLTSGWKMKASGCDFAKGKDTYYKVASAVGSQVTLNVEKENSSGINYDTLVISTIFVNEVDSVLAVPVRVPLMQAALEGTELIWSAVYNKQRYYIMAGSGGLIARKYNLRDNTLYKNGTTTHLIKGMKSDTNSDDQYITPWQFDYHPSERELSDTLMLYTKLTSDSAKFYINGSSQGAVTTVRGIRPSLLIWRYANVYTNDNANYEEQVRLRYGADGWLKLTGVSSGAPIITLTADSASATVFSWAYLHDEYSLLNNGAYPSQESVEFGYNREAPASVQTLYKARHEYSMLVDNTMTYLCRREQTRIDSLTSATREWKTSCRIDTIRDHRVATLSALNNTIVDSTLTTTITPVGTSPMNVTYGGEYVNIVDTLRVTLSLQDGAPAYRFKDGWSKFTKISDANLKIPLIRRTYHEEPYNRVECSVEGDKDVYTFPATIVASGTGKNDTHTFTFHTTNNTGAQVVNVYGEVAAISSTTSVDLTGAMNLKNHSLAQVGLADEKGNIPSWCVLSDTTANTVTVKCTESGIRSSRIAYLYLAYIVMIDDVPHFVNFRITISQQSLFEYANNQHLVHSNGASGDDLRPDGMQQVHENRRILYYYPEQDVELPVRERAFYGWWRWYREGKGDIGDSDVPDSLWRVFPRNIGKYNFPYRIIGDSVDDGAGGKKLVTMGRYTVFHYPSKDYGNKNDPPSKSARVAPPVTTLGATRKDTVTYAVDMSNYYDNLPMSLTNKNNVDIEMMDTMTAIIEPTLSIREVFELHPWTEMAEKLEGYKYADPTATGSGSYMNAYMEDHEVMAPIGNRLLLRTEQRYNYENLTKHGHSESLLGYYMRDDNWSDPSWSAERKDTMIWCGGWDADCRWFSYNTMTKTYAACTHSISTEEDFLVVPARTSISEGHKFDTIYYFLRARSKRTTTVEGKETTVDGGNWFNICRYKIIYHQKDLYGPKEETAPKGEVKALITNDEIEQNYEVLERLNFDYNKPGTGYTIYPHPLPWADASYGYTYPETSDLPHNRYHDQSDFPNHGEYGLINRIPYDQYWRKMEQHGGAANGYMIYCDGMASAGQVAALTLHTRLCEGQSMYFSGYVGNPSSQTGKSDPNFIFSVQGSTDGSTWEDITSYMTGDIKPSNNWYQIYFPINHNRKGGKTDYSYFRVQIFNVAANFDGNDFVIDDMCIFATKPPLLAYQANTRCVEDSRNDSITQVVLRLDYKGFTDKKYNNANVYYTVVQSKAGSADTTFVKMDDGYLHEDNIAGTPDTIYGYIEVPEAGYMPIVGTDSIYPNMGTLVARFEANAAHKTGYIYETLDGVSRPVLYVIHQAKMAANKKYNVHMALSYSDMLRSICAMTSELKVTNRMMLELNGEEQQNREENVCPNSTYTLSMRVKGTQYVEGGAPLDLTGSCVNDWLLYGDTAEASSYARYGHYYSDIVKVVKDILRANDPSNTNQFANNLSDVNRNVMVRMQGAMTLKQSIAAYDLLADMVNKGYLTLYKSKIDATVMTGSELEYVVFPIIGSGSKEMEDAGIEVCPQPIHIKLTPSGGDKTAPLVLGGIKREATQLSQPLVILANEIDANKQITIHIDSIQADRAIHSVSLLSTDDPNFLEGSHTLNLLPNKVYGSGSYYNTKGDDMILTPESASTYHMRPGYNYTFIITMQTSVGATTLGGGCPVGEIPFTVSVVPDYLRWDPKNNESNRWNNPENWVGVSDANEKIHDNAHFAPLASSNVIIPTLDEGLPYPVVPDLTKKATYDSIKQIGFEYNTCNVIRFMPGAAMAQQQNLNYNKAVVDLSAPHEKWALRSAPVTGMLSGDLFMANVDLDEITSPWEVGYFDANGRNKNTGNASFWLSVYNTATVDKGNGHDVKDSARTAAAEWSKVTNGMTLSLPPASGWAVYTRTTSRKDAIIRLPKNDDIYYYYNQDGDRMDDIYEHNLQYMRDTCAGEVGGSGKAGKLAFDPDGASQTYTLKNGMASTMFVFGNPTMGYIDIWGFMDDNPGLLHEFDYITYTKSDDTGSYMTVTESMAVATENTITEKKRYLPPMHAIVLKATSGTSLTVTLDSSRVVTSARDIVSPSSAPSRMSASGRRQGFMTVTAINPLTSASKSRLLIGQGYHNAVRDGEDAMLTTININEYNSSAPSTLFNIYASEGEYGLSVDLLDEVVNVPVSFCNMSGVPFEPVTELWFTGVYNIDGELVFYDALTGSEQTILDGICIKIPTPEQNHEKRYYIRRRGFDPNDQGTSIATDIDPASHYEMDGATAVKIIKDGHVLILRDGHVYTMFGQKLR